MSSRYFGLIARFLLALMLGYGTRLPAALSATGAEATVANGIESLMVTQQNGNTMIKVGMKQALTAAPASFSVAAPARVVFDFPGTGNSLGRTLQQVNEGELRSINIVQVGDRTRLVLNLKRMGNYQTQLEGKDFLVTLMPTLVGEGVAPTGQHFAATGKSDDTRAIRDIKFRRGKTGEGLVTVDLSDADIGVDVRQQGPNLLVEFQKVRLAEELR